MPVDNPASSMRAVHEEVRKEWRTKAEEHSVSAVYGGHTVDEELEEHYIDEGMISEDTTACSAEQEYEAKMKHMTDVIDKNDSYDVVSKSTQREPGALFIDATWVMALRDDKWKARLCARDYNTTKRDDLFAPGSSTLTNKIIDFVAEKRGYESWELDVTAAYNTLPEPEDVYMKPPKEWLELRREAGESVDVIWKMKRLLPGRRIAARMWVDHVGVTLRSLDFLQDTALPQFFVHPVFGISCEVHMDDIHGAGPKQHNREMINKIGELLTLKKSDCYGPGEQYEHLKRVRHLYPEGRLIAPNKKYVEGVAEALGLSKCKPAKTPEVEANRRTQEDSLEVLDGEWGSAFRSHACTLMYAGHDIAEAQHAIRELTCDLREPTVSSWTRLKHTTRYLTGVQGEGLWYPKAGNTSILHVKTDTDWAGSRVDRKSCTCYVISCGGCTLNVTSIGQSIHAQSSGEAEFYGGVSGLSAAICVRHILSFFGFNTKIQLGSDSSAARAVMARAGVGKIRHLEVKTLWIQELVKKNEVTVVTEKGTTNVADIGTKILNYPRIMMLKRALGIRKFIDRHHLPEVLATSAEDTSDNTNTQNTEQIAAIVAAVVATLHV
jgi:hypothetical protein